MPGKASDVMEELEEIASRNRKASLGTKLDDLAKEHSVTDFQGVHFKDMHLSQSAQWATRDLRGAIFEDVYLNGANFKTCKKLQGAKFIGVTDLTGAHFNDTEAEGAEFKCTAINSKFHRAILSDARFDGSDLSGANFSGATLDGASLRNVVVNTSTSFGELRAVKDCTIDRYVLACLGPGFGSLTEGQRMDMKIIDDVAVLRLRFSGFWFILHFVALVAFLLPYVLFVLWQWAAAKFDPPAECEPTVTLLEALIRFIFRGRDWKGGWTPNVFLLIPFLVMCSYNVMRAFLLYKTKTLEAEQTVSGLPVKFLLKEHPYWNGLLTAVTYIFFGYLFFVAVNTWYFLLRPVSLD